MKTRFTLLLTFGIGCALHAQSVPRVEATRLWTTGQALGVTLEDEGFEAGLGNFTNSGVLNWTTTGTEAYEGAQSATSNTVFAGQNAILNLNVFVPLGYTAIVRFYLLADTSQGPDMTDDVRIGFKIDGITQSSTIIPTSWTQKSYFLSDGNHVLSWEVFHAAPGSDDEVQVYLDQVVINYNRRPSFRMADGSEGFGKVLMSDVHGNASWQTLGEMTTFDNINGNFLLPLTLDGRHQILNPLRVVDGNGNGIQSSSNVLNGFTALNNLVNGYRASTNGSNGFLAVNNGKHGFEAMSNTSYGFYAASNGIDGFMAENHSERGYTALNNGDDGFYAEGNTKYGFNAENNQRGFYAVFNTFDGFYAINNSRGFNAHNNGSDGFYASNNLRGFRAIDNQHDGFHADFNAGYGFYAEQNEDDGFFSEENVGNGYSAFANTADGYLALENIGDGFESKSNSGHGVYAWLNTGDGVLAFDNGENGFTADGNDDNGFEATNNGLFGMYAFNNGSSGVYASQNNGDGVVAVTNSGDGFSTINNTGDGLYAIGNGNGVYAFDNNFYGVRVHANTLDGIYSHTNSGDEGYFSGTVTVTGNLTKGGGSFKIDHPLDPENKFLYHSFVESPDMMNVYNGNVLLDINGEAIVVMEAWFGPLNRDFRYQLTAIGAPGPNLHIAEEMRDNQFRIAGGTPGMRVSWQVTGIRQDRYANHHRIEVEVEKPAEFKGYYLHPEVYGGAFEQGFDYVKCGYKTLEELAAQRRER